MTEMSNEELVALYQSGNNEALDILVARNQGLVHDVIIRNKVVANEKEDTMQMCNIELIKAAKHFDTEQNTKFSTFATRYMDSALYKERRNKKLQKNDSQYYMISLNQERLESRRSNDPVALVDIVEDYSVRDEFEGVEMGCSLYDIVDPFIKNANKSEKVVFNLVLVNGWKQEDVGKVLGVGKTRVNNLKREIIKKLKGIAKEKHLDISSFVS